MKKTIVAALLLCIASFANAECIISSDRTNEVSTAFKKYGGWAFDNYAKVCKKLLKTNAVISIVGHATVLSNRSIGWVALSVKDKDTGVATSAFDSKYMGIDADASQNVADKLMVEAINLAANDWISLDKALVVLEEERKKAKSFFGKQK